MSTGPHDFAARLIRWQREHGRHDLPWQNTRDPYRIWLSEIMLQQTQVETVIPYYHRFLARFPDLAALAAARLDDVLALWSGLGYYARARNLHRAANIIVDAHGGHFPRQAGEIAQLPGIGRSTAAAIAAFAFDERGAILDGNVKRVLTRAYGVAGFPGQKAVENRLWELAESLLPPAHEIAVYTQAQMDLGATLCTRARPACTRCPFATECVAHREGRTAQLPTPRPRKAIPTRQARFIVLRSGSQVLLEPRPLTGIWGGLLALPESPPSAADDLAPWLQRQYGVAVEQQQPLPPERHAFSHYRLEMDVVLCEVAARAPATARETDALRAVSLAALDEAGLPAPVRRILDRLPPRS